MSRLALFDLDNTLLTGDSEVLWLDDLRDRGLLDAALSARNAEMDRRYRAGEVTAEAFCGFYAATFAGRTPAQWQPQRDDFFDRVLAPRIPAAAQALVQQHREAGDLPVLTTASSRFLTEPSARALGFAHVIATELEQLPDGRFSGFPLGTLNMREGKVVRLRSWIAERGLDPEAELARAVFYSDSRNDLPLLRAVGFPCAVYPDPFLLAEAGRAGWPVLRIHRIS